MRRTQLAEALWMRARSAGAWSELDRRLYGIADDTFAAGLLVAHMAFVPFCEPGTVDGPTLQVRLRTQSVKQTVCQSVSQLVNCNAHSFRVSLRIEDR